VRLLLDTAILIHAVQSPERLSRRAVNALEDPENILELSTISLAEIEIKASLGKLGISSGLALQAIEDLDLRILPYSAEHALRLFDLPLHHRDPFDRLLLSVAEAENFVLLTADPELLALGRQEPRLPIRHA
jgi:PIN domain nuclease of toxin-antitoxin system